MSGFSRLSLGQIVGYHTYITFPTLYFHTQVNSSRLCHTSGYYVRLPGRVTDHETRT